jgi:hypothetical protein
MEETWGETVMKRITKLARTALLLGLLQGCVFLPQTKIDQSAVAVGPRHLSLQMQADPNLVAFDLRAALEQHGFEVDDSTAEPDSGLLVQEDNKVRTYKRVTESNARYALLVNYTEGFHPLRFIWRARVVDKQQKRTLSTYSYDWNAAVALNFKWSTDKIIADMLEKMVVPLFPDSAPAQANKPR